MTNIELMKSVLYKEAVAIEKLANNINEDYNTLLDICSNCKGKIVLTGMGKSGHIARKISATMASLGTPSFFIHPAEAAHGDLGMIEEKDIVIMISKSGETDELCNLINSLKIIGCKLIGVFCKAGSSLENYCDYTVVLPMKEEACIYNLAPTVSTTLSIAFGDALAVVLSEIHGFNKNDFALFHPKGTLGKQLLLTAYDLAITKEYEISVDENTNIKDILWHITQNRLGAVAVVKGGGELIGLITDGDIRRTIENQRDFFEMKASQIMITNPIVINNCTLAVEALRIMSEKKKSVLPIVDKDNKLIGIVSYHDIVLSGLGGK